MTKNQDYFEQLASELEEVREYVQAGLDEWQNIAMIDVTYRPDREQYFESKLRTLTEVCRILKVAAKECAEVG